MKRTRRFAGLLAALALAARAASAAPTKIVFDTDIGNDVDDALALAVLHELADRGEAEILAVTVSKANPWAAVYVDLVDAFYGRPEIPVGLVRDGKTPDDGKFIRAVAERSENGLPVYPRRLKPEAIPDATTLLRKTLAAQPDGSVTLVSVGFLTNMARLLDSPADDASPLSGAELVKKKIALYVMMAGAFSQPRNPEYNVFIDAEASKRVFERWPTPIVASGYEIGEAIRFPAAAIEHDFAWTPNHPVAEAYRLYMKMPYDRQCWDLTAVLFAVRWESGYFGLSYPGRIALGEKNVTEFAETKGGNCRYLTATPEQAIRTREALVDLASSPPGK